MAEGGVEAYEMSAGYNLSESDSDTECLSDEDSQSVWYDDLPAWMNNPKFNRYWNHHRHLQDWYHDNKHALPAHPTQEDTTCSDSYRQHALSNAYTSSYWMHYHYANMLHHQQHFIQLLHKQPQQGSMAPPSSTYVPHSYQQRSMSRSPHLQRSQRSGSPRTAKRARRRSHSQREKRRRKEKERSSASGSVVGSDLVFDVDPRVLNQEDEIIECHMEITEEMLDFFAQSAKHREERDAQKAGEAEENRKHDYVDISRANTGACRATTEAPKERPGTRRTSEMKILYGTGAPMIHGMETALQLTYDRNLDLRQPKLWPHLPLNIKF